RGKAGKKFFERVILFEIIEERLYRYTRSLEHWRSTEDFRIHRNEIIGFHDPKITDMVTSGKRTPRRFDPRVAPPGRIVASVHRKCRGGKAELGGDVQGTFDNETSRKPLVSAADAVGHGES